MTQDAIQQFAAYLATITDDSERARAIAKAKMLGMQNAPDSAFEAPIRTLGEYLASPIEIPPVLVEPLLVVRGGLHATIGRAGKGKTVVSLNRLLKWSCGRPLFDDWKDADGNAFLRPSHPLRILIIENEGAAGMFHKQIGHMLNAEGFLSEDDRKQAKENVLIWGEGGYSDLKFDDKDKRDMVRAGCEKWKPDLVFIEPFRSLWAGDENSSTEMGAVVDALVGIASEFECATWIAHHESKGGYEEDGEKMSRARGSTVLEGIVTIMENFESVKAGQFREMSWSKARHATYGPPPPVRMEWVMDAWWYSWVPSTRLDDAIIEALRDNADEPMSVTDLSEVLDETKKKVRDSAKRLADDGKLRKLPSIAGVGGSTGVRFARPEDPDKEYGGLSL